MVRFIDPGTLLIWAVFLVFVVVALVAMHKSSRLRGRLMFPFANRKRRLCTACLLVLLTSIYVVWRCQDADAEDGRVTKIDATGKPITSNGRMAKFMGRPTEPGTYRVSLGKRRYFILHLPEGYQDDRQNPLPVLCLLHGGHQEDPVEWAMVDGQMNQYGDRDKFILVYPAAQPLYSILWQNYHSWNSSLETLSDFNSSFEDDAQYLERVHRWLLENTSADPDNFNLGGFSEGALMAANIAQSGTIRINCLIACGGTLLEGQQQRHLNGKGPKHALIQLNTNDTKLLCSNPDAPDEVVVSGELYDTATRWLGYVNFDRSKPLLQESYWVNEALAGGGTSERSTSENEVYRRDTYLIRRPDGRLIEITVYRVHGQHAWHGSSEGGDPEQGIEPRLDFPMGDIIARFILAHKVMPRGQ